MAKGIAIILMVIAHAEAPGWLCKFVFEFHMPLFFITAGYFFSTRYLHDEATFVKKRVKGLYWPFVKWALFFLILHNWMPMSNIQLWTDKFPYSAPYAHAVKMEMSIEYCSLGVALATIAAFMVVRKLDIGSMLHERIVRPISEASYGMYLLHMFVLAPVSARLIPHLSTPLAILATAAISFAASAVTALFLRRLPVVGKCLC